MKNPIIKQRKESLNAGTDVSKKKLPAPGAQYIAEKGSNTRKKKIGEAGAKNVL